MSDSGKIITDEEAAEMTLGSIPDGPIGWYRELWESINGNESWDANTYVWVISFERLKP